MNLANVAVGHPGEAVALVSRGKPITYGELERQVAGLRGGLQRIGIQRGDRVALLCANNRYFVVSYLAVIGIGAIAVPLNPSSPALEQAGQLAAISARAAVVDPKAATTFRGLNRASVPDLVHVLAPGDAEVVSTASFDDLVAGDPAPILEVTSSDVAVLIFTAGTAGFPKAAILTHGSLKANLDQVQALPGRRLVAEDVVLGVLPLFHIFGLNAVLGLVLVAGCSVVLVDRFDPTTTLDTVTERGVTVVPGAPPLWVAWSALAGAKPDALAGVRLAVSGASKLSVETMEAVQARFGVAVSEGYGLTETSPVVTSIAGTGGRPGTVGRPLPGVEVRLMDGDDDALLGDTGEIWVRGPNVFAGYWEDPEATANALTADGWLRTGDMAVADDEGALTIVDRAKDLIIVSGFNVFPAEVEEVLIEHPGIERVAVVGVESPYSGEAVKAWVVAEDGRHLDEDDVIEFCAARLARYKCPTKVLFVDEIPEGMGGKVLRRALR